MKEGGQLPDAVRNRFITEGGLSAFAWIAGALVFVGVSGLGVWVLPFNAWAEMAVLFHTVVGLAVLVPFTRWQLRHWLAARKAPRTFRKICAYSGFSLLAASCATGLVVTCQALFALRVQPAWDRLHLWSSILALPFLSYHLFPAAPRRPAEESNALPGEATIAPARRRMWARAARLPLGLFLVLVAVTLAYRDLSYEGYKPPSEHLPGGGTSFFSPSFAATSTGRPVAPEILANSESCGSAGCHAAISQDWLASAHHWSAEDEFFQAVRSATTDVQGLEATEKCGACHDPVSLLAGYKDPRLGRAAPGYHHGDSCLICHAVRRVDSRGIGSYEIGVPKPYLFEYNSNRYASGVAHFLIRAYPNQHDRDYDLKLVRLAESCAPCHKEWDVIDKSVGAVQVETQYDDWRQGKWNADPDASHRLRCQQCHMYYLTAARNSMADPYDVLIGLGTKYRNHYFAAGNQFMPEVLGARDAAGQVQRVTEWLHGKRVVPEISGVWPSGPIVALRIEAPPSVSKGASLAVRVVLTNEKVGHSFPTGPLNIGRAWIEMKVRDDAGRTIFHSGELDNQNHIEAGSFILRPLSITTDGKEIMMPDLWHPNGPKFRPAIPPGHSATCDYQVKVPLNADGPLFITARLRYRKANQFFMDAVYTHVHREASITDISSGQLNVEISRVKGVLQNASSGGAR